MQSKASKAISGMRDHVINLNRDAMQWSPYKALAMVPSGAGGVAAFCSLRRARMETPGGLVEALRVLGVSRW